MASIGSNTKPKEGFLVALAQVAAPVINDRKDIDAQVQKLVTMMHSARACYPGLEMIIFPEYSSQGLNTKKWMTDEFTFEVPGKETEIFAKAAKETKLWAVFVILERNPHGHPYDTALVFNPEGKLVLKYRKLVPWAPTEPWSPGDLGVPVVDGPAGSKIAVIICHDGMIPELAREAAYKGANVLIRPAAYPETYASQWDLTNRSHAWSNLMYTLSVSLAGYDGAFYYMGKAQIVNFDGTVMVEGSRNPDEIIKGVVTPREADDARITWGSDNNIYQLGHRGYDAVAGGEPVQLTYMKDLIENKYHLPWDKEVEVVDGSAYGYETIDELRKKAKK